MIRRSVIYHFIGIVFLPIACFVADVRLRAKYPGIAKLHELPLRRASNAQKKKSQGNETMIFHISAKVPAKL
jgi:hypothetical protein